MQVEEYFPEFDDIIVSSSAVDINMNLSSITSELDVDAISVDDRVKLASHILKKLSREQRIQLSKDLIVEQVVRQKNLLSHWSLLTAQSAMIDTGYIAQHLVSLETQIAGQGMRGKGDDLCDGSEVKGANFIDSLDKHGATAPRWNFNAVSIEIMERFLAYPAIFLLSIDLNPKKNYRIRIWKVDIAKHQILRNRYIEWMNKLGYPKFRDSTHKSINFQLFPPHNETNENFARHGNGRKNGFEKLEIPLEDTAGSELIFRCDIERGVPIISKF
jgi:hypothetical protein